MDTDDQRSVRDVTMAALKSKFRPEFLNRIDEFVQFKSLGLNELVPIISLELDKVNGRLEDKKLKLTATDGAKEWMARVGYDPAYGARPLKRMIQKEVETPLARKILGNEFKPGSTILIDAKSGHDHL